MDTAHLYRQQAARLTRLAIEVSEVSAKIEILDIADQFLKLARHADGIAETVDEPSDPILVEPRLNGGARKTV
jgi:hypothetical protein